MSRKKKIRNLIIALLILLFLVIEPFWGSIKSAITGEELQTGATPAATQEAHPDAQSGASPEEEGTP